jgi:RNAse (barnase) inhibitor barstar
LQHLVFDRDLDEMESLGYRVRRFDCSLWSSEEDLHVALKKGLQLPEHTGSGFDALADSLTDIVVPDESGVLVAVDNLSEAHRADVLLGVLAVSSRWWPLFGRIFCVALRTDDPKYVGPVIGGRSPTGTATNG